VNSLSLRTPDVAPPNTDANWKKLLLSLINDARTKHKAPALKWLDSGASLALTNSNKCKLVHSVCRHP
jgi:hypothetical protein